MIYYFAYLLTNFDKCVGEVLTFCLLVCMSEIYIYCTVLSVK